MQSPDIFSLASAFIMHTGARHTSFDLTDAQKRMLSLPIAKFIILFALFYMSTRSIYWSLLLLFVYFILVRMLLNETHPLNVIPKSWLISEGFLNEKQLETENVDPSELYLNNIKNI